MKTTWMGAACTAAACLCAPVAAQGWYGGIELAPAQLGRAPAGLAIDERHARDVGGALVLGRRWDEQWSFELGWRDIGRARWRGTPPWCQVPPGMLCTANVPFPQERRLHTTAWVASAVWQRELGEGWSWRARLGLAAMRHREQWVDLGGGIIDIPIDGSSAPEPAGNEYVERDERITRAVLWIGAGLRRTLTPALALNLELQTATGPRASRPVLASVGLELAF